jgi:hypothetical protein
MRQPPGDRGRFKSEIGCKLFEMRYYNESGK